LYHTKFVVLQEEEAKEKENEDEDEVNRLFFAQVNEDARRAISHEMLQEQTRVRQVRLIY
jgi:hypothetical protein